jgi:hypothetical protein
MAGFLFGTCSKCCDALPCSACDCDSLEGKYFIPSIAGMSAPEDFVFYYQCAGDVDCNNLGPGDMTNDDSNPCLGITQEGAVVEQVIRNGGTMSYKRREYGPCVEIAPDTYGRDPWIEYMVQVSNEGCSDEKWNFFITSGVGPQNSAGCQAAFRVQPKLKRDGCPLRIDENSYGQELPSSNTCPDGFPFVFIQPKVEFSPCVEPDNPLP